ncbi:MAG: polysulfide reductase NrfD [Desulfobacterales bacterium]|nr:polysulfide reductase NrfD [Desulfobacterales bacterium]
MLFFNTAIAVKTPDKSLAPLFLILTVFAAIGLSFGIHALIVGHDHVFGTSREVPWGLLITPYVFFACLSTGLCIISSLGQVFHIKTFVPLVNRAVFLSIIAMSAGLISIGLEVESPWRMILYGIISPNPNSNIWWKSAIYTLYILLMIFNFLFLLLNKTKTARGLAIGALIAITCGNLNMNSDMALLGSRGFWAENYMPLFFLIMSTLLACCSLTMFVWLSYKLHNRTIDNETRRSVAAIRKLTLLLLIGALAFGAIKILGGFSTKFTENPLAMQVLVHGDFAVKFWIGEIILTSILPLFIILLCKENNKIGLGAFACLSSTIGVFITFYNLIIVGQLVPHFTTYDLFDVPRYYSYSPSLHEAMMTMGVMFFFIASFVLGEIILNSASVRDHLKNMI